MSKLRMRQFKVQVETSEEGQDSPYFVFFSGNVVNKSFSLTALRQSHWDNEASSGDTFKPNTAVVPNYDGNTMVLCALMEEDVNADVVSGTGAFNKVKEDMQKWWEGFGSPLGISRDEAAKKMMPLFRESLEKRTTNDEFVDCHSVHIPTSGEHDIPYKGAGGTYIVRFDVV
jgi:hypothetical protein